MSSLNVTCSIRRALSVDVRALSSMCVLYPSIWKKVSLLNDLRRLGFDVWVATETKLNILQAFSQFLTGYK